MKADGKKTFWGTDFCEDIGKKTGSYWARTSNFTLPGATREKQKKDKLP